MCITALLCINTLCNVSDKWACLNFCPIFSFFNWSARESSYYWRSFLIKNKALFYSELCVVVHTILDPHIYCSAKVIRYMLSVTFVFILIESGIARSEPFYIIKVDLTEMSPWAFLPACKPLARRFFRFRDSWPRPLYSCLPAITVSFSKMPLFLR